MISLMPSYCLTSSRKSPSSSCVTSSRGMRRSRSEYGARSEEHTSELQSQSNLVCRLLLEKKKNTLHRTHPSDTRRLLYPRPPLLFDIPLRYASRADSHTAQCVRRYIVLCSLELVRSRTLH